MGRVTERVLEERLLRRRESGPVPWERAQWFRSYTGWIGDVPKRLRDWGVLREYRELMGFAYDAWEGWPIGSGATASGSVLETRGWWLLRVPYWFLAVMGAAWPLVWAGA